MHLAPPLSLALLVAVSCSSGRTTDEKWVTVASVEWLLADRVVYSASEGVFVVLLEGGDLLGLSDDAQHIDGESVLFCAAAGIFIGPHGEVFDGEGRYVGGPARTDLDLVQARIEGDEIQVEAGRVIRAVDRSDGRNPDGGVAGCEGAEARPGFVGPDLPGS